ncbi:hypothetical protein PMAYCL1PPCAC_32791, partial [Pristionchus mayeri]
DSQDVSLFSLSQEGRLGDILVPFEYVLSVTARGSTLFALTSNGRILTLDEEFKVTGEAKLPPQKKQVSEHARIDYVDISGLLIVLFANTLYFFRIEDKSAELLYSKTDVLRFDLSASGTQLVFPDHDLVYVTTRNQVVRILLSIGEQCRERVLWKWRADSLVSAISFDGSAVCLTTQSGCYVHPFESSSSADPILAFPIDRAVLPLNAPPPSICHVNEGDFVVAGCMPDMALFVDGSGSAARPPLIWSHEHPRSVVRTDSCLVVIGETKLIVFDNVGRMRQELALPSHPCASGLAGDSTVVIFTRSADADVFCVRQMSWAQKASDLLEKGEFESALYVVRSNEVKTDEDLIAYRQVYVRLGFEKLASDEEDAISMLLEGQVTPFDVTTHFSAIFDKSDSPRDTISDVILVEKLISRVLEQEWSEELAKDWATLLTLARARLCESPIELIDVLETSEDYDHQAVADYADGRKMVNAQLVLRTISGPLNEALSMDWLDPALSPLVDRLLLATLLQRIDSTGVALVYKWRDLMMEEAESEQLLLELVRKRAAWFKEDTVIDMFEGRNNELDVILPLYHDESYAHSTALTNRLALLVTDRLSPVHHESLTVDEGSRLRKLLIEIILREKEVTVEHLLMGEHLTVERVVAANRTDPEKAIQGVIESVEFPGALQAIQQILHHFASSHASLSTHFLHQLKRKCESDPLAGSSLRLPEVMRTVIEASPALLASGAIKFIPENSQLETFAPLIFREVQSVNDRSVASRLARALGQRATQVLEDPLATQYFKVTESSRCGVCSGRFDKLSELHFLPSGKIVHPRCQPHLNLCPITNQVFRG